MEIIDINKAVAAYLTGLVVNSASEKKNWWYAGDKSEIAKVYDYMLCKVEGKDPENVSHIFDNVERLEEIR